MPRHTPWRNPAYHRRAVPPNRRNAMRTLSLLILVLGLSACRAPEPSLTDADRAEFEQTIAEAMAAIYEGASVGDEEGTFRSFHPDGTIASDSRLFSFDEFRSSWRDATRGLDRRGFPNSRIEVKVVSPTLALSTMTSGLFCVDTLGVSSDTLDFVVTMTWSKEDGLWRVIQTHESSGGWK